jgi:hypothetical protein
MNPKLSRAKRLLKWTQKPTKDRRKHPRSPSLAFKDMGLGKILIPCTKHGCTPMHWVYAYIRLIVMPSILGSRQHPWIYFSSLMGSDTLLKPNAPLKISPEPNTGPSVFLTDHIHIILSII